MKLAKVKTDKYHNWAEGDCGKPIDRKGKHLRYYKKGFWKRLDRKKFIKNYLKHDGKEALH